MAVETVNLHFDSNVLSRLKVISLARLRPVSGGPLAVAFARQPGTLRQVSGAAEGYLSTWLPWTVERWPLGALKMIAAIENQPVIVKILSHLGLPTHAPPRSRARRVDLFQTI